VISRISPTFSAYQLPRPLVKWIKNMIKKQSKENNYYCKICGARFGDDGRAFEVGTLKDGAKDWYCYYCKIDEMSPEALKEFAKLQLSKHGK